jgi:hypothetical protein
MNNTPVTTTSTTVLTTAATFLLDMHQFIRHRAYRGRRVYTADVVRGGFARVGLYRRQLPADYSTEFLRALLPDEWIEFRAGTTVTTVRSLEPWTDMEPTFVIFDEADVTGRPRVSSDPGYDACFADNPQMWS